MTTPPPTADDLPPGCSAPRDLTGTPGHAALRAYWGVPAGGHRRTKRQQQVTGDIVTNLMQMVQERNARHAADYEARARKAWEIYQAGGVTREEAAKQAGITMKNALRRWRQMHLVTRV